MVVILGQCLIRDMIAGDGFLRDHNFFRCDPVCTAVQVGIPAVDCHSALGAEVIFCEHAGGHMAVLCQLSTADTGIQMSDLLVVYPVGAAVGGVIGGIAGYFAGDKFMKQKVK